MILYWRDIQILIDDDDADRVLERSGWYVHGPTGYVMRNIYEPGVVGPVSQEKLHRFVMGANPGDPDVDHKNRNKLDNRKENLRFTEPGARSQNRTKSPGKTSRYMGVSWDRKTRKWRARVGQKVLGYFTDEQEAARVAVEGRRTHFPYSTD